MLPISKFAGTTEGCDKAEVRYVQFSERRDRIANIRYQENQPSFINMSTAKDASTAAAMQAVFQTSELVENILVHLPAKTIFGVQRVSKSFNNAVKSSLPIKEKLFLRLRPKITHKVIAHGFQHTAAALNPFFIQGAFSENYAVHYMSLSSRAGANEKYGMTMEHNCVISMESSLLNTYLLEVPFKKLKLSLRLWVGQNSPTISIKEATVDAGEPVTIRTMIDSVCNSNQKIYLAFDEDRWRGFRHDAEFPELTKSVLRGSGRLYLEFDSGRDRRPVRMTQFDLPFLHPHQVAQGLFAAKMAGREATWGCEVSAKPSQIFGDLQAVLGLGFKMYVSLSQQPTFVLHDIVVPSPEEWAKIEARNR